MSDPAAPEGPRRPHPLLRLLVVAFGLGWLATAGALRDAGGVAGWVLAAAFAAVGVAIIAIASGLVELVLRHRRG